VFKKDYSIGLNLTGNSVDDPPELLWEPRLRLAALRTAASATRISRNSASSSRSRPTWRSARAWSGHQGTDRGRGATDHRTQQGGACWQPYVKNVSIMVNSIYNGWRFEDIWLDK
jgi:peptide/nickel transport system substrate-binding protein